MQTVDLLPGQSLQPQALSHKHSLFCDFPEKHAKTQPVLTIIHSKHAQFFHAQFLSCGRSLAVCTAITAEVFRQLVYRK